MRQGKKALGLQALFHLKALSRALAFRHLPDRKAQRPRFGTAHLTGLQ